MFLECSYDPSLLFPKQQTEVNTLMTEAIRYNIEPRSIQFDGFPVARLLPRIGLNSVGPWLFFDHMGPHEFEAGQGLDVPPLRRDR